MTSSGIKTWSLTIDELIDEAYERIGGEHITGRDSITARRAMNLFLIDLINRNIPLATMQQYSVTVQSSVNTYALPAEVLTVMYGVLDRGNVEIVMEKKSLFDYKSIPVKTQTGRPTLYTTQETTGNVNLMIWPSPENSTDVFNYWAVVRIDDITGQNQTVELPVRAMPMIVSGMAYYLALKHCWDNPTRIQMLKMEYEDSMTRFMDADRERSSLYVVPSPNRIH